MKDPVEKELITEIAELFKDHQEAYEPGEWEAFSVYQKGRYPFIWRWVSIAAVFLIVISLLPFRLNNLNKDKKIKNNTVVIIKGNKHLDKVPAIADKVTKQVSTRQVNIKHKPVNSINIPELPALAAIPFKSQVPYKIQPTIKNPSLAKTKVPKDDFMDFLKNEAKLPVTSVQPKKHSKWDFGVELLSTVLQSNVNIGAGLTTEYKLSENFSVSSGIAFMQLEAGKQYAANATNTLSTKRLLSVDANIQAIDIPVTLTYNVNKQFYTSVGLSYFNVISESRNNKYLTQMPVSRTLKNPETGEMQTTLTVLSGENNEPTNDLPLKGNSYLGFFNFSVGHKQEIFNHYKIVVEPFVKIPVGKLSNEDLKLTNGGLKVRFSF